MIPIIKGKNDELPLRCTCGAETFAAVPLVKIAYSRLVDGEVAIDMMPGMKQFRCAGCWKVISLGEEVKRCRAERDNAKK